MSRFRRMWRVLKSGNLLFALLVILTGCSTPPRHAGVKTRPPDWGAPEPAKPAPVVTVTNKPAPPVVTNQFTEAWISLGRWSQANHLGTPQSLSETAYALTTASGILVLQTGSRTAHWNGLKFQLGFAPQRIDGKPFVHSLDIRKNFVPLQSNPTPSSVRTNRVIVLDPGHGGANTGTKSVFDGRDEKEYTLDWARRLEPLLATNGWRVVLTRTNDADVSGDERVAVAERCKADLFVSLHFNSAAPAQEPAGLETYCTTPTGMPSSLTRDYPDDPSRVFPNNSFDELNLQYALRLHRALLAIEGKEDRGVGRARFMTVLREQNRPAVLVEGGYLSNPIEARTIADPQHRQKLAEAVAKATE